MTDEPKYIASWPTRYGSREFSLDGPPDEVIALSPFHEFRLGDVVWRPPATRNYTRAEIARALGDTNALTKMARDRLLAGKNVKIVAPREAAKGTTTTTNGFKPGLTGHELARRLLALPDLPVVYDWDGCEYVALRVSVGSVHDGVSETNPPEARLPCILFDGGPAYWRDPAEDPPP